MLEPASIHPIPYIEYRAIGRLLRAHVQEFGPRLRAIVAFGDQLTRGNTFDIDLLEVVEGWGDPQVATFHSTADLPLRGEMRLHLLAPQAFETVDEEGKQAYDDRIARLLVRVRHGYEIIMEQPPGYARQILEQEGTDLLPASSAWRDPLRPPSPAH